MFALRENCRSLFTRKSSVDPLWESHQTASERDDATSYVYFSTAEDFQVYSNMLKVAGYAALAEKVRRSEDEHSAWWLHAQDPTPSDIEQIGLVVSVHPQTLKIISTQSYPPVSRIFDGQYMCVLRYLDQGNHTSTFQFSTPHLTYLVVLEDGVLTVTFGRFSYLEGARKRVLDIIHRFDIDKSGICFILL